MKMKNKDLILPFTLGSFSSCHLKASALCGSTTHMHITSSLMSTWSMSAPWHARHHVASGAKPKNFAQLHPPHYIQAVPYPVFLCEEQKRSLTLFHPPEQEETKLL